MTGYSARLRNLEHKLVPGDYPLCAGCSGRGIDIIRIQEGETPPPRPVCEKCGKPRLAFIVEFTDDVDDELAPSEQRAADLLRRAPAAESVPPARDNNGRAETAPKPRTRRRQWYG